MIDLHSHSTCSDGSERPARVVELAAEAGCSAIALTDHDNLAGLTEAGTRATELGITFVPGCEVSCDFSPGTMHVLCYFVGDDDGPLARELAVQRQRRAGRNTELLARLGALGMTLDAQEVAAEAGSAVVGRPHFAAVLMRRGYVDSIEEAFERYLKKGAPAYVERAESDAAAVFEGTRRAGGVAALAHPLSLGLSLHDLERRLAQWREEGLVGVECYYSRYDARERRELTALTRARGLVPTGGSDFHGSYKPGLFVGRGNGDLEVPDELLAELVARRPAAA